MSTTRLLAEIRSACRTGWLVLLVAVMAIVAHPSSAAEKSPTKSTAVGDGGWPTVVLTDDDRRQVPRAPLSSHKIDELIEAAAQASGHRDQLAAQTGDEQFLRRVMLDLSGTLPTPEHLAAFVAASDPLKRAKLIDQLLASDDYARHWARFWRDVVTARLTQRRSMGLTRSFEAWLHERLRAGDDWGAITRAILTAEGELRFSLNTPSAENGSLFFLVAHDGPEAEERAAETSRVFLGIQIQCAQCHDHPTEQWKRTQFHEFAAYFARIKYDQLFDNGKLSGVQLVRLKDAEHKVQDLKNPDKFSLASPRFLDGQAAAAKLADRDRRQALAHAVTDSDNFWFAAAHVNRVWNELMGYSFYPHVDDLGPLKPVRLPEVLTALVGSFQASGYDTRALIRTIANSAAYQRQLASNSAPPTLAPLLGARSKRLRPDVLWDSLVHVFGKIEPGARFHTGGGVRFNASFVEGRFRAEFDFDPSLDVEEVNGTLPQTLFLMNNATINKHLPVTRTSVLGRLLREHADDRVAIAQLYRLTLARQPTEREQARCTSYIATAATRDEAFADLLWALINSTEFQRTR